MSNSITISDNKILTFYKNNPHLNIVTMNHIFIDILQKLSSDMSKTIHDATTSEILSVMKNIQNDINLSKKEYTENVKTMLVNSNLSNNDKVGNMLSQHADNILTKTTNILNDIIPKNQTIHYKSIENTINNFYNNISQDTKKILQSKDNTSINEHFKSMDTQFNNMTKSLQQPIFSFITASEERVNKNLNSLKENAFTQSQGQEKLTSELLEFLNRYKNNSSVKGSISENILYGVIQSIFPTDEIVDCRSNTASGDFIVNRLDKSLPTILFENKDYKTSVNTYEVDKFIRDVQTKKCHGIFLSQFSPITYKKNFQIDIKNGLIQVYIPNAGYDTDKIKTAIDIIDTISLKLSIIDNDYTPDKISIPSTDIDEIVEEYKNYGIKRIEMIDLIKTNSKQMLDNMEDMQFPCLRKTLVNIGREEPDKDLKCHFCNAWTGKNKYSVGAHMRKCKMNPKSPNFEIQTPLNIQLNTS